VYISDLEDWDRATQSAGRDLVVVEVSKWTCFTTCCCLHHLAAVLQQVSQGPGPGLLLLLLLPHASSLGLLGLLASPNCWREACQQPKPTAGNSSCCLERVVKAPLQ
jgi:hypothetical protein